MVHKHISNNRKTYSPNDVILTPNWVFEELNLEFDLDPAHPNYSTNVPAKSYYTEEQDGLANKWEGLIWCNPPFSNPTPWADKFIEHNNGLFLCQMSRAKWFNKLWASNAKIGIMPNNFKFEKDGKPYGIFMPVALFALGNEATKALIRSDKWTVR